MPDQIFLQCRSLVNKNAIKRFDYQGEPHISIDSFTMPAGIVMNGLGYSGQEIDKAYQTLEGSLAPIGHPTDTDGNFVLADTAEAINTNHGGAWNKNVAKVGDRIKTEIWINETKAKESAKGRELLEAVNGMESGERTSPVHTSTGVLLNVLDHEERTNSAGQKYSQSAINLHFDHNAILLHEAGAATPETGRTGMAINKAGQQFVVNHFDLPGTPSEITPPNDLSHEKIHELLSDALNKDRKDEDSFKWPEEVFADKLTYSEGRDFFSVSYVISNGVAQITGMPIRVDRNVVFTPKTNRKKGDPMDLIKKELKANGIEVDGLDDAALLAKYNEMKAEVVTNALVLEADKANQNTDLAEMVTNATKAALAPLLEEIETLKANQGKAEKDEIERLATIVGNAESSPLTKEEAVAMPLSILIKLEANTKTSIGLGHGDYQMSLNNDQSSPTDMPD